MPACNVLECLCSPQQLHLLEMTGNQLKSDWQTFFAKSSG
jgi:hypothetical protein